MSSVLVLNYIYKISSFSKVRNISILLSLLFVLSTCKKDEDTSVLVNASVANTSEGSIDFKSGDYSIGSSVTFSATPKTGYVFSNWTVGTL